MASERWRLPPDFHDSLTASLYAAAHEIAADHAARGVRRAKFDFDRTLDRILTSRWLGFPVMLLILMVVFWLTVAGANVPSAAIASVLIDKGHPWLQGSRRRPGCRGGCRAS
ncbi:MAG: hypothetical protein R2882_02405 [Gemmatimonadales bacterium]